MLARAAEETSAIIPIHVERDGPGRLSLRISAANRRAGLDFLRRTAAKFQEHVSRNAAELREAPSAGEEVLSEEAHRLRQQAAQADDAAADAAADLPASNPRVDRASLLARWQVLREDWSSSRATLERSMADAQRLRSQPEPTAGIVLTEERRVAIEQDGPLQQDLRELAVRLSELRLHLLTVWQNSAGRLDQLRQAADEFQQSLEQIDTTKLPANVTASIGGVTAEMKAFREMLGSFIDAWTAEFTGLQRNEVDAFSAEVLDANERLRKLAHDFLFNSGQRLSTARKQLKSIADDPGATSRHHVLHSNLTRGFQSVQGLRHRFEFAAGALDTPDNFRLDSSLRAARGLRRRTQERIEQIERKLLAEARQRARQEQAEALAEAQQAIERTRAAAERTVEDLFTVQEGLLAGGQLSEEFAAAVLRAELAAQRVLATRQALATIEGRLSEMASQRRAAADSLQVELVSCEVVGYGLDGWRRARLGLIGFVATFIVVLVGQRIREGRP